MSVQVSVQESYASKSGLGQVRTSLPQSRCIEACSRSWLCFKGSVAARGLLARARCRARRPEVYIGSCMGTVSEIRRLALR